MEDSRIEKLEQALRAMERRCMESKKLLEITRDVNRGVLLDEVLNSAYESLRTVIPFDRMGLALVEEDGAVVRAHWARSESLTVKIEENYSASLAGSSLETIIKTGQPRILNDLVAYLREHPQSDSTQRIVEEGMRSSLTCPLTAMARPIGFLFFSSMRTDAYRDVHTELFAEVAAQFSMILEKSVLYERLLALDALKTKFLVVATHDLRNPLTTIQWCVSLLEEGLHDGLTESQKNSFDVLHRSCAQMLHIVEDFLDASVIEAGRFSVVRQETDLAAHLQRCCECNRMVARSKSIEVKLNLPASLPMVFMDQNRMDQVINNLISNAVKFSNPETVITISAKVVDAGVQISVRDQGPGIPQEELCKLFSFFGVTSVTPTVPERSTGVGLAIARQIVELHGGRIWVESVVNEGSTFSFILPVRKGRMGSNL